VPDKQGKYLIALTMLSNTSNKLNGGMIPPSKAGCFQEVRASVRDL
jgi:hypothetical protein